VLDESSQVLRDVAMATTFGTKIAIGPNCQYVNDSD